MFCVLSGQLYSTGQVKNSISIASLHEKLGWCNMSKFLSSADDNQPKVTRIQICYSQIYICRYFCSTRLFLCEDFTSNCNIVNPFTPTDRFRSIQNKEQKSLMQLLSVERVNYLQPETDIEECVHIYLCQCFPC